MYIHVIVVNAIRFEQFSLQFLLKVLFIYGIRYKIVVLHVIPMSKEVRNEAFIFTGCIYSEFRSLMFRTVRNSLQEK